MDAVCNGDLNDWELVGARGCCRFRWRSVGGVAIVEVVRGCHACLNELNVHALERGYRIIRVAVDASGQS